jgi:hypothetical protein
MEICIIFNGENNRGEVLRMKIVNNKQTYEIFK